MSDTRHLEERLAYLEDLRRKLVGSPLPRVCRLCYSVQDGDGKHCYCLKSPSWSLMGIVIAELYFNLNSKAQAQARTLTQAHNDDTLS